MAIFKLDKNTKANEAISKFKLLSAYGGAGSILHTQYGSIIISCIEEWGFLKKVKDLIKNAEDLGESDVDSYVIKHARLTHNGSIGISNDSRFLGKLKERISDSRNVTLQNLRFLVLIPDIEIKETSNTIKDFIELAIASSFMPKVFFDKFYRYHLYNWWFKKWTDANPSDQYGSGFFPPIKNWKLDKEKPVQMNFTETLSQDNIVLICENGHISDFPWSKFLRWRINEPLGMTKRQPVNLFGLQDCCNNPKITIKSSTPNASGYDGKRLKCEHCQNQVSLKGLFNTLVQCLGHKPWEADTGDPKYHSGDRSSRNQEPPNEPCSHKMKIALTTGNNLYYSRVMSSIYLPSELFKDEKLLEIEKLELQLEEAKRNEEFEKCRDIKNRIDDLKGNVVDVETEESSDSEREMLYRYQEYMAFSAKTTDEINIDDAHLKVVDATEQLSEDLTGFFHRVLRIDNIKITSAQLDFSRVAPADGDSLNVAPQNIFRSKSEDVLVYPVVENYGEGIFFAFNHERFDSFQRAHEKELIEWSDRINLAQEGDFHKHATDRALDDNWQLYLVHTFAHLVMRELEFRCGYPTSSLQERLYISNDQKYRMYGCTIYTAEGAEGSMGGLIAQAKGANLWKLIKSALTRATICHSDPLCWESQGQGLFDLNFASCFSCSLVSETSCELRNIHLDRRILVDEDYGFFKGIIKNEF